MPGSPLNRGAVPAGGRRGDAARIAARDDAWQLDAAWLEPAGLAPLPAVAAGSPPSPGRAAAGAPVVRPGGADAERHRGDNRWHPGLSDAHHARRRHGDRGAERQRHQHRYQVGRHDRDHSNAEVRPDAEVRPMADTDRPLTILYFAWLRERVGTAAEELSLTAGCGDGGGPGGASGGARAGLRGGVRQPPVGAVRGEPGVRAGDRRAASGR